MLLVMRCLMLGPSKTQKFPTPTQCERLGEPENVCQVEGGLVPDEREP